MQAGLYLNRVCPQSTIEIFFLVQTICSDEFPECPAAGISYYPVVRLQYIRVYPGNDAVKPVGDVNQSRYGVQVNPFGIIIAVYNCSFFRLVQVYNGHAVVPLIGDKQSLCRMVTGHGIGELPNLDSCNHLNRKGHRNHLVCVFCAATVIECTAFKGFDKYPA